MASKGAKVIGILIAAGAVFGGIWAVTRKKSTVPVPTLSSIVIAPASPANLAVGGIQVFVAVGNYSDGSTADITSQVAWHSSAAGVANINSAGVATGIAAGLTSITASMSGVTSQAVSLTVIGPGGGGGGNAVSFTVDVLNKPTDATGWGCAFQDPATGQWYQPVNHPPTGSFLFDSAGIAQLSVPVSQGIFSISAFSGVGIANTVQLVNYQLSVAVEDGGAYTFDFSNQTLTKTN